MIKRVIAFLLLLAALILLVNYSYSWSLGNRFISAKFDGLVISYMDSKSHRKTFEIKDKNKINEIYKYLSKQHGRKYFPSHKYFPWHVQRLSFDEHYFLYFYVNGKATVVFFSIYASGDRWNVIFSNNDRYRLDKHTFNSNYFKSFLN